MEPALSPTILKFSHFFPATLQAKTAGISNLVDDEAGSILQTKGKLSLSSMPFYKVAFIFAIFGLNIE